MKVTLYLDGRAVKAGSPAPIKIAIRRRGEASFIPTGLKALPEQWDSKSQHVSGMPSAMRMNVLLSKKRLEVERALLVLADKGELADATMPQIRDKVLDIINPEHEADSARSRLFVTRFTRYMEHQNNKGTRGLYAFTLRKLEEFDKKLRLRTFEDITRDYLQDFEGFCSMSERKNTRNIHLRNIRAVFNDAIDSGVTSAYPFRKYALRPEATMKKALTAEQLRTLAEYPCEPYQEEYRDIFLLMFMLRGINIGDLLHARHSDIIDGRLNYRRNKVGTLFSVKLEPEALAIIERHKGRAWLLGPMDRYKSYLDYLHHLNKGLKAIGKPVGKHGKKGDEGAFPALSSNWARHTWATIASRIDIPKDVISKSLGHGVGLSVTDIYIDFDNAKVDEANRRVLDFALYGKV